MRLARCIEKCEMPYVERAPGAPNLRQGSVTEQAR